LRSSPKPFLFLFTLRHLGKADHLITSSISKDAHPGCSCPGQKCPWPDANHLPFDVMRMISSSRIPGHADNATVPLRDLDRDDALPPLPGFGSLRACSVCHSHSRHGQDGGVVAHDLHATTHCPYRAVSQSRPCRTADLPDIGLGEPDRETVPVPRNTSQVHPSPRLR